MTPAAAAQAPKSELRKELLRHAPEFRKAAFFSIVASLMLLAPTVYMLEVYDRVLNSRSATTLLMLLALVIGVYVLMELLDLVRLEVMSRTAGKVDAALRARLFDAAFLVTLARGGQGSVQAFSDLRTLREFMSSPAVTAILDSPTSLVFLAIVFWMHPLLGVLALTGAVVQALIALRTERSTMPALTEANRAAIEAQNYASGTLRSTQVIEALGMMERVRARWMGMQRRSLRLQADASDHAGTTNAIGRFVQTVQGSMLLGVACWLGLRPESAEAMSGGAMIVASVLGGRVLAPLVQMVAQWRLVVNVRDSYDRLAKLLDAVPDTPPAMPLPAPEGRLTVEGVVASAPGSPLPILRGVSFAAQPGEVIVIVGPTAAGKTTLARLLVGVWPATSGNVRLDGVSVFSWNKEELGPHVGYLPQGVELFDGTVAENIARFGRVDLDKVRAAAVLVGLDAFIESLPDGYDTRIGEEGAFLSGGERQRVALARALYGMPRLVVLDEPNSSLDAAGDQALAQTLAQLKAAGCTTLLISHRTSVLPCADRILVLHDGQVAMFGPRDEVLAALQKGAAQAQQARLAAAAGGAPPQVRMASPGGAS